VQTTSPLRRRPTRPNQFEPKFNPPREQADRTASQHPHDEIGAYIAIRNMLLAYAEKSRTIEVIASLATANDVVATCLRAARSPYQAQHLSEKDAIRERKVCREVKRRIAQLTVAVAI
jgi:crotonobetainyl-CoA:carnitine CoA-transferase CaiB-like acyl-CoA transferase